MIPIKVLIAMPIYKREDYVLNCITSLVETTVIDERVQLTIALAVNAMNETLSNYLTEYVKTSKFKIDIHLMDGNVGKGIAVNNVASKYKFDYLISMDSDMICIDRDWLMKMLSVYIQYDKNPAKNRDGSGRLLGSLCTNQIGNTCHVLNLNDPSTIKLNPTSNLTIITSIQGGGIAGGILMSSSKVWNDIKGYEASKLYATDDGHYHADCAKRNLLVGYVYEVKFYHPYEFAADEYCKWKQNKFHSDSTYKPYQTTVITQVGL